MHCKDALDAEWFSACHGVKGKVALGSRAACGEEREQKGSNSNFSYMSFVDADGEAQLGVDGDGRQKLCALTPIPCDSDHLPAAAPLSSLQNTYLFQRCSLLLTMSVGADLSFGDLLWKFKLYFGSVFFFFLCDF